MDNIHAGWLTKSPRQRKTSTLLKLFRSVGRLESGFSFSVVPFAMRY